jgi:hypothetical protein
MPHRHNPVADYLACNRIIPRRSSGQFQGIIVAAPSDYRASVSARVSGLATSEISAVRIGSANQPQVHFSFLRELELIHAQPDSASIERKERANASLR